MSYIAFFDLDHTILKINSGEALLRRAHKIGVLSKWKIITAYFLSQLYKFKIIDSAKIIERFAAWLANHSVRDIESLCNEIVEKDLIPAIHPQIIDEIKRHKDQGANIVILSSAIASICFPVAKHLEISTVICSELEELNQLYTGLPKGKFCLRDEKLNRMNQYLHANNLSSKDCYYYGDSIDDLPVLKAVGFPICINPDKSLEKIARKQNWTIHDWK